MGDVVRGRPLVAGSAEGLLLVSNEPLSFWGGYDAESGEIIDRRHPLSGKIAKGTVFAVPSTRGSSTTTAILLEAIRAGAAPAAILTQGTDSFVVLAAVVAEELYGRRLPLVALNESDFGTLESGRLARVDVDGAVRSL